MKSVLTIRHADTQTIDNSSSGQQHHDDTAKQTSSLVGYVRKHRDAKTAASDAAATSVNLDSRSTDPDPTLISERADRTVIIN